MIGHFSRSLFYSGFQCNSFFVFCSLFFSFLECFLCLLFHNSVPACAVTSAICSSGAKVKKRHFEQLTVRGDQQ